MEKVGRDRRRRYFKKVKGNQAICSVLSGSNSCSIQTRHLSCYCESCVEEEYEACKNADHVSAWQTVELETESRQHNKETRSEAFKNLNPITDLLTKGAIVASASGDPGEEYYLLKIIENGPENLEK